MTTTFSSESSSSATDGSCSCTSSAAPAISCDSQRRDERTLVDDRTASRVDEDRGRAHRGERALVDQVPRLRGQRAVQADDVGRSQDRVQVVVAPGQNRNRPERLGEPCGREPDAARPDDGEALAVQPLAEHELDAELPRPPLAQQAVALDDAAQQREGECDRELGGRLGEHVGCVRDDDAALACGLEVDVVDADPVVRDDAELRPRRVEERAVDLGRERGEDPVCGARPVEQREALAQRRGDRRRHRPGDVHERPRRHLAHHEVGERRRRLAELPPAAHLRLDDRHAAPVGERDQRRLLGDRHPVGGVVQLEPLAVARAPAAPARSARRTARTRSRPRSSSTRSAGAAAGSTRGRRSPGASR